MSPAFDDINTPRLVLRLMGPEAIAACLADDLAHAERLLDITIPRELLDEPGSLEYDQRQQKADQQYQRWSSRAIILPETRAMIGLVRFHSRPDPEDLRSYARNAVELGYRIFTEHRRRGYASEAVKSVMDWAQAEFGVSHFIASVSPDNLPSLGLITQFDFTKVGERMDEEDGLEHVYLRISGDDRRREFRDERH